MSGVGDYGEKLEDVPTHEMVKEVMALFNVSEEIAMKIIAYCNTCAVARMEKWKRNWRKIKKREADDIYRLTRSLKRGKGDSLTINELEKRILELCVET